MKTLVTPRALTAVSAVLVLLSGCGAAEEPPSSATSPTPETTTSAAPTAEPAPATTPPAPSATPTPSPTTPPGGSGDADKPDTPATAGGGICSDLEPSTVGAILGGTVTGAGLSPSGCEFTARDASAPAATFVESSFAATPGGMSGAKQNATSAVEGEPEDLTGIGTAAFVVTGTMFGGEDVQGAGAVRVGDRLVQVTLSQARGLERTEVRALVVKLLRLVAAQAAGTGGS